MRHSRVICLTVLCLAGLCTADESGFVRTVVDFAYPAGFINASLAVDSVGAAHLVYLHGDSSGDDLLMHAVVDSESCTLQPLAENPWHACYDPFLSITPDGQFTLALSGGTSPVLGSMSPWYDWVYNPLPFRGRALAMEVSDNGLPYLLMLNIDNDVVYFVWFDIHTGLWQTEYFTLIDHQTNSVLTMDRTDDGQIMATIGSTSQVSVMLKSENGWISLPPLEGSDGRGSFLPDGTPAAAYTGPDGRIYYAIYIDGGIGWISSPCGQNAQGAVLAFDHSAAATAGIAYFQSENGKNVLYYATNVGAGWTQTRLDNLPTKSAFPQAQLAFDNTGKPLIAYLAQTSYWPALTLASPNLVLYCVSDINHDGKVDLADFAVMSQNWMLHIPQDQSNPADIDKNQVVDRWDLWSLTALWLWPAN